MQSEEFEQLKQRFITSDIEGKIDIYTGSENLTSEQYKELLRHYPLEEIDRLEKALA